MPELEIESAPPRGSLDILDELIKIIYERLHKNIDENLKVGDLLKMIELRHKLAPSSAEQEKFWAMLAKIRRDTLNPALWRGGVDKTKKNGDQQKAATGRISATGRIRRGERNGE